MLVIQQCPTTTKPPVSIPQSPLYPYYRTCHPRSSPPPTLQTPKPRPLPLSALAGKNSRTQNDPTQSTQVENPQEGLLTDPQTQSQITMQALESVCIPHLHRMRIAYPFHRHRPVTGYLIGKDRRRGRASTDTFQACKHWTKGMMVQGSHLYLYGDVQCIP